MLDLLGSGNEIDALVNLLGGAAQTEFAKTCGIFALAAFIHSRQVRKEIRAQFGELVGVLREDLDAQKSVLAQLSTRVSNIESQLHIKGES